MKQQEVFGINEPKLDNLVLEIGEIAERIKAQFLELEDLVDGTVSFYECECGTNFRNSFAKLRQNFPIVNKNILCYSQDLVKVKARIYGVHNTVEKNFTIAKGEILSNSIERYKEKY